MAHSTITVGGLAKRRIVPTNFFGGIVTAISICIYNLTHFFTTVIVRLHLHIRIDVDGK